MSNLKKTTTTIPVEAYTHIRVKGYKVSELVLLGLKARENNPQLIERINRVENMLLKQDNVLKELEIIRRMILEVKQKLNSKE